MPRYLRLGSPWYWMILVAATMALVFSALPLASTGSRVGAQPVGGPIFLSGDDADDFGHCPGTACGAVYPNMMSLVYNNSTSGGTGIAAIGVNSSAALSSFNSWNSPANGGPGAPVTHFRTTTEIQNANFAAFRMIYIPSTSNHTGGGMNFTQLADLNARQTDIVNFVNTLGGGLMALTEAFAPAQYGWLPLSLTVANMTHSGFSDIQPTANLTAMVGAIPPNSLNHGCCYHTVFTGPAGFSGLQVLATHPADGHVVMLGGLQVTIQGTISLAPATDTNDVGTTHTVTATAEDGSPLAPAVGVTVTFTVTAGPNAGTTGTGTSPTDAAGQASFTYTGSGGPGTDLIVAQFTDAAGNVQTSNTVEKIWVVPPVIPYAAEYRWAPPAPGWEWDPFPTLFRSWTEVRFENVGAGDAFNMTATLTCVPVNVTVVDGQVTLGDIPSGGTAWSSDSFTLEVDMTNPQDPSKGIVWRVEYDDAAGMHHVIDDVPKFHNEPINCP